MLSVVMFVLNNVEFVNTTSDKCAYHKNREFILPSLKLSKYIEQNGSRTFMKHSKSARKKSTSCCIFQTTGAGANQSKINSSCSLMFTFLYNISEKDTLIGKTYRAQKFLVHYLFFESPRCKL